MKELNNLDRTKNGTFGDIPSKCLKLSSNEIALHLLHIWNHQIIDQNIFQSLLKLADVTLVFKVTKHQSKIIYRPVSVLPNVSKICERIMLKQILEQINKYLSQNLCGYREGISMQTALTMLPEKWKKVLDDIGYAGAVLMDLSKAFDTINHELLIAKLHAYGFSKEALTLIASYLSDRWQHVKINDTFTTWSSSEQDIPQGSVLGPVLFNIYLNDLFFASFSVNVCNFADDTTPFVCDLDIEVVLTPLEECSELVIAWFKNNYMKLNTDKCHLLVAGHKFDQTWVRAGSDKIWDDHSVKLRGVSIDNELKLDKHVSNVIKKANSKLSALSRVTKSMTLEKKRTLYKAFFESQFKYFPLTWMFHGHETNYKINRLQERALRLIYNDHISSFEKLL